MFDAYKCRFDVGWDLSVLFNRLQRMPDAEIFSFVFNTLLSDVAARCPEHRDRVIEAQVGYRASHVLVDWVLLTWIWDVPPPCLGSR